MIKKYKIIAFLLAAMLMFSACGKNQDDVVSDTSEQQSDTATTTTITTEKQTEPTTTTEASTTTQTDTATTEDKKSTETTTTTSQTTTTEETQISEQPAETAADDYENTERILQVGDYIVFGLYEQDNNITDGKEMITWRVLDIQNGKALVISTNVLTYTCYHAVYAETTWENSTIRDYLNTYFYRDNFYDEEKAFICDTTVTTPDNQYSGRSGGNDTVDKLFCLSVEEVIKYFDLDHRFDNYLGGYSKDAMAYRTVYAIEHEGDSSWATDSYAYEDWLTDYINNFDKQADWYKSYVKALLEEDSVFYSGSWWLRTPGSIDTRQCRVDFKGGVGEDKTFDIPVTWNCGVRPAMWIDVEKYLAYEHNLFGY